MAFVWSTGMVWASFEVGESAVRASAPAVTGPLTVAQSGSVVAWASTSADTVTTSALGLSLTNYYGDLTLSASATVSAGSLSIDTTGLSVTTTSASPASITVAGSSSDVVTAMQSRLTWTTPQVGGNVTLTIEVTSALPQYVHHNPTNGHLYLVDPTQTFTRPDASSYVSSLPARWGRTAHLVTITSQAENDFLSGPSVSATGWIGASDIHAEGNWKWIAGPENGEVFWDTRLSTNVRCGTNVFSQIARYNCWTSQYLSLGPQPDNWFTENYAELMPDGKWRDLDGNGNSKRPIVEYSGTGTVDAPHHDLKTFTLVAQSRFAQLVDYADNDATTSAHPNAPDGTVWTRTGITGTVDASLSASLNTVLALPNVGGAAVTDVVGVQTLVDAYRAVLDHAANGGSAPTSAHYSALGVTGLDAPATTQLGVLVRNAGVAGVDTASELAALAAQAVADTRPPPPVFVVPPPAPEPEPEPEPEPDEETEPEPTPEPAPPADASGDQTGGSNSESGASDSGSPSTEAESVAVPEATAPVAYRMSPQANGSPASSPLVVRPNGSALVQSPMSASAYIDGAITPVSVNSVGPNQVEISGSGFSFRLSATDASGSPVASTGSDFVVAQNGRLTTSGRGFAPSTRVDVWAFSDPVFLGSTSVAADGSFAVDVAIPTLLAAGDHTLQFTGTPTSGTSKAVSFGIRVIEPVAEEDAPVGESVPPVPDEPAPTPKNAPPFEAVEALSDPANVVEVATTGVAVLAVASSAAGAAAARAGSSGSSAARGGERTEERAELGSIDVVGIGVETQGEARGDASRLWRWPGTALVDRWSASWTVGLGPRLPLVSRLVADGSALRAIFGGATALLPLVGVVLGVWAATDTTGIAMPPTYALMLSIIVLGVIDSFAGALAFVVYAIGVVLSGGILDVDSIRALMGIGVLCFAPGLIASAFRAIRRPPAADGDELWERLVDFPVVSLLAGMTAQTMVWALNGVAGVDFPFGYEANSVALVVIAVMFVKLVIEECATRWFPARLATVSPPDVPEPSTLRRSVTIASKTAVYIFIVSAILGNVWQLWVSAALFALPLTLNLVVDRLPNSPLVWRLVPLGVPSLVMYFLIGTYAGIWIEQWLGETPDYARTSFVAMLAPFTLVGVLYLLGREPKEDEVRWCYRPRYRWVYRIGGIGVLIFAFSQHMGWV
jgi:hypothetical protein